MLFILLVFAWLAAPIVELVIIIILCVQNGEYKRKIAEFARAEQSAVLAKGLWQAAKKAEEDAVSNEAVKGEGICGQAPLKAVCDDREYGWKEQPERVPGDRMQVQEEQPESLPGDRLREPGEPSECASKGLAEGEQTEARMPQPPQPPFRQPDPVAVSQKAISDSSMGTAALIIGVILVVLAGIIFATTSWRVLPSFFKAFLVLALSGVFFGASVLAEKKLHIYKTGNAFYLLSSIFLFLSVLAAAYFRLLGTVFILEGDNRWWVLWVGSLVTLTMLFLGIQRFHDKTYTQACFWGMTVSMTFLMSALNAGWGLFISAMTIYAFLLVLGEWRVSDRLQVINHLDSEERAGYRELLADGFQGFAPVHFWIFAVFLAIYGTLSSFYLFSLRPRWYVILALAAGAAGSAIQARQRKAEGTANTRQKEAEDLAPTWQREVAGITPTGQNGAGGTVQAQGMGDSWSKGFFSLSVANVIHCGVAWGYFTFAGGAGRGILQIFVRTEILVAVLIAEWLTLLCFFLGRKKAFWLRTDGGDAIYTAFVVLDNLMLLTNAMVGPGIIPVRYLAAFVGMLPVVAAVFLWGQEFPVVRKLLPLLFWYMLLPIHGYIGCGPHLFSRQAWSCFCDWTGRGLLEFVLLGGLMVWDRRKKMGFGPVVFIIGLVAQIVYFSESRLSFPFFLLLSLFAAGEERPYRFRAAALCSMIGCFVLACPFTQENLVLRGMIVICVYWAWLAVDRKWNGFLVLTEGADGEHGPAVRAGEARMPDGKMTGDIFWQTCGCILMAYVIIAFYGGSHLAIWNLLVCLAAFAGFYMMFYLGRQIWPHLLITFLIMPVPEVLLLRYGWSENLLYGVVGGCYLVTGIIARYVCPIVKKDMGVLGGWRVDWYHAMAVVVLAPMAFMDFDGGWRFVYLLLIGIYFLQYGAVQPLRRLAWSGAAAAGVLAFWSQPFVHWPEILELEISLLPVAIFIWGMGYIWREPDLAGEAGVRRLKAIRDVQTAGYGFLLLALCLEAWATGDVVNALILEGICLGIFLWAQVAKNRRWVRISGILMVVLALYMTKGFWLSISWWVYLLAAGVGLILFAAVNEKRKH